MRGVSWNMWGGREGEEKITICDILWRQSRNGGAEHEERNGTKEIV